MTATRPIRICRVIARMNGGGPAVHLAHLAAGLDPGRFSQITIAGRTGSGEVDLTSEARSRGMEIVTIPSLGRELSLAADTFTIARLVRIFRQWKPDIVETHTAKAGTVGRLAAMIARVPVRIHVFHGHVFHGYFSPAKTRFFLEVERALGRTTTRIIALGERQRADLLGYGIGTPSRVTSIPLGFDLTPFKDNRDRRGTLRAELGIAHLSPSETPVIGIVGRLVPIKAHEVFLDAARAILSEIPGARFVIAGEGERRTELEQLAKHPPLAGRVHFLGWRHDTASIYADLDLVLLTSDNEGMPVTIIESLASAVPVVATAVGGVPDLVRDGINGILTPPRDSQAIARASITLLQDSGRRARMGASGRETVIPEHEVETLVGRMTRLYKSLVPNPAAL